MLWKNALLEFVHGANTKAPVGLGGGGPKKGIWRNTPLKSAWRIPCRTERCNPLEERTAWLKDGRQRNEAFHLASGRPSLKRRTLATAFRLKGLQLKGSVLR